MHSTVRKIVAVLEMTKPKQLALLMVTMYGAYFVAGGGIDPVTMGLLFLTGVGSAGGVTALNMYIERDIDSAMPRTRSRPLPRGDISPQAAIFSITVLIVLGVIAAGLINKWVMLTTLIGLYFDIITYTELFKRHTPWALIAGSIAGSMPALGGWAAGSGTIDLSGILLAGLVFVWQPLHVSSIHVAYDSHYRIAGIPTLYKRLGYKGQGILSIISLLLMILLISIFIYINGYGYISAALSFVLWIKAIKESISFINQKNPEIARKIIKLASPAIGIIFILLPLEKILFI